MCRTSGLWPFGCEAVIVGMRLRQLWDWVWRQVATRTTTTPTRQELETQVQLLAETRAPSPAELAELKGDYNPKLAGKSKADFFMETGMTPEMYLLRLLDAHGGTVTQTELVTTTGWPPDTLVHLLTELEAAGYITRAPSNDSLLVTPPEDVD